MQPSSIRSSVAANDGTGPGRQDIDSRRCVSATGPALDFGSPRLPVGRPKADRRGALLPSAGIIVPDGRECGYSTQRRASSCSLRDGYIVRQAAFAQPASSASCDRADRLRSGGGGRRRRAARPARPRGSPCRGLLRGAQARAECSSASAARGDRPAAKSGERRVCSTIACT